MRRWLKAFALLLLASAGSADSRLPVLDLVRVDEAIITKFDGRELYQDLATLLNDDLIPKSARTVAEDFTNAKCMENKDCEAFGLIEQPPMAHPTYVLKARWLAHPELHHWSATLKPCEFSSLGDCRAFAQKWAEGLITNDFANNHSAKSSAAASGSSGGGLE